MNIDFGNPYLTRLRQLFFRVWRPSVLILTLAAVVYLLYFRRLALLLPGYSAVELNSYFMSSSWHLISANPVNAPYFVPLWLFTAVAHHGLLATRAVAACFGTLAVVAFFIIIRPWYSFRIASLGTLLFATSAGFLHITRLGTPYVLQMGLLALFLCVLWYRRDRSHRTLITYVLVVVSGLLWYIPGLLWFEVLGAILLWPILLRQLQRAPKVHLANWALLLLVVLAPLIRAVVGNPHLLLTATGLPSSLNALPDVAANFYHAVLSIGIRGNGNPLLGVGHLPLLNAAELILGAVGAYAYLYRERSLRTVFLVGALAISLILMSFNPNTGFAALVPLLYFFIVHGLDHLLGRWFTVFPRNPIARITGVAVACCLLFFSIFYQVRAYFIAWPHTTATKQTFNLSKP